jgi:hypothetical protein
MRSHQTRLALGTLCGIATVAFGLGAVARSPTVATPALAGTPPPSVTDVTLTGQGRPIPRSFFGLSIEYTELADYERLGPSFDNVVSLLRPGDGSPLLLRLGGRSADQVVWVPSPAPPTRFAHGTVPRWVSVLSPEWLSRLATLVRRDSLRVELQLNVAVHSPAMAVAFARAARAALPANAFGGFAIGNEPDLYRNQPWLRYERVASTASVPRGWPIDYTAADYMLDYLAYARALRQAIPGISLTAPDITYPSPLWLRELLGLGRLSPQSIAIHRYATATCNSRVIRVPTPLSFLDNRYTTGLAGTLTHEITLAHANHLPLRVTEMNSFTCGGRKRIAESFATALWAPDALFEMLRAGVDGVSWHIHPSLPNAPFHVTSEGIVPLPELYGVAVFAQMIGPQPQLDLVHVTGSAAGPDPSPKVWVVDSANGLKLLALDKGPQPATIRFHDPAASGTAELARLLAPTVAAQSGVTFAGQSIGADGRWQGQRIDAPVANRSGVYEFRVPAFTAAVLSVPR